MAALRRDDVVELAAALVRVVLLWVYRRGVVNKLQRFFSDRYAIRTRNLQDWNLTRYRCANRSNASGGVRTHASEEIGA